MVCKELHFTKAAKKLGISQPTLSHQIKLLEQKIGYPLFNRVGKKIELTNVGEMVQKEAMKIQSSVKNISAQIDAFKQVEIGELKIAVLPGEITDLTSSLFVPFNQLFPNIKLSMETTDEVEKAVLENRADFGIGLYMNSDDLLEVTKLYEEEFYMISNEKTVAKKVPFTSAIEEPLVLFPNKHQCRKLLDRTSAEIGEKLNPIVETSSIQSILDLVRMGVGRTIVSRTLYEFYDTEGLYYQQIEQPHLTRFVYLVQKKNSLMNYAAKEYIKLLVREIEKLHFKTEKDVMIALQRSIS